MFRYLKYYILPMFIFLTAVGIFFGGIWLWLPALSYILGIAILDQFIPHDLDESDFKQPFWLDLALYASTPAAVALFLAVFWTAGSGTQDGLGLGAWVQGLTGVDVIALRNATPWYHYVLMFFAIALPITGAGGLAGHELTHRTWRKFDLWLGRFTMALNWGIAFPIEHVYGHHSYVGTSKDPATAARGDSVYTHIPKAMYRTVVNAWEIELNRLDKLDKPFLSPTNALLRMAVFAGLVTVLAYFMAGWMGVLFHITVCLSTKIALEILNYIEHYGLLRVPDEPVQPRHSWNCNHAVSGVFTYNLTRHSHHHADAQVPFQDLRAYAGQPEMPGGFVTAYLTALFPPLWRKRIAPRLQDWDENYASEGEKILAREANEASGWSELTPALMAT